jgi:hypothetical protein
MRRVLTTLALVFALMGASGTATNAKSIGDCPSGSNWQLVTVESLGIDEDTASGIPSLDGNADGWTCIKPLVKAGGFVFRDNTVQGP